MRMRAWFRLAISRSMHCSPNCEIGPTRVFGALPSPPSPLVFAFDTLTATIPTRIALSAFGSDTLNHVVDR